SAKTDLDGVARLNLRRNLEGPHRFAVTDDIGVIRPVVAIEGSRERDPVVGDYREGRYPLVSGAHLPRMITMQHILHESQAHDARGNLVGKGHDPSLISVLTSLLE